MSFFIKVCGVTRPEDADYAASLGVNAIGLNFWRGSRRFVEDDRAKEIIASLPDGVLTIGVFVNAHPLVVTETLAELRLDAVQLHGDERVGDWSEIPRDKLVRAFRIYDDASMKDTLAWDARFYIYDAYSERYGGSGEKAPWPLIAAGARHPFLLAGGLEPGNVAEAIAAVRPDGVDVASGVESAPGVKDRAKMRAFVENARRSAATLGITGTVR